ncbi:MAG: hypothetical protein V5A43_07410 [Haloarculaceae archaeon]
MAETTDPMYDLSGVLDVEDMASVEAGRSLLVTGPAMSGKEAFVLDALGDGLTAGETAIAVTTDSPVSTVIAGLEARVEDIDHRRVGVIDCRADSESAGAEADSEGYVHHVRAPSDLTGIGIGITNGFERFSDKGYDRGRVGLTSLSTMLTYTDRRTVFKFCHVLSSRLDNSEYVGLFTIDDTAHDDQTMGVLKQAFDGMIEIRADDDLREARVRGLGPEPSDWVQF